MDVWCSVIAFHTPLDEIERIASTLARTRSRTALTVIDNGSTFDDLMAPRGLTVEVVRPGQNLGYGVAHNLAIERSRDRCRYHLVLNSDIQFEPEAVDALVDFMDGRPDCGLAMPLVRYPDGEIQNLCRLLPDPAVLLGRRFFAGMRWAKRRNRRYEFHGWSHDRVASFPFLSGCFMFMRREVLDRIGGFDPRYFLYAEDLDLSRRIHAVAETLFFPGAAITHEYRSLKRRSWRQWLYAFASLSKYFNKWGWLNDVERDAINAETLQRLAASNTVGE